MNVKYTKTAAELEGFTDNIPEELLQLAIKPTPRPANINRIPQGNGVDAPHTFP